MKTEVKIILSTIISIIIIFLAIAFALGIYFMFTQNTHTGMYLFIGIAFVICFIIVMWFVYNEVF